MSLEYSSEVDGLPGSFERELKEAVIRCLSSGESFGVREILDALKGIEADAQMVESSTVARRVNRLCTARTLRDFGYERRYVQQKTQQGKVSALIFVPLEPPASIHVSKILTQTPPIRPLGYLDLPGRQEQRLQRQTNVLLGHLGSSPKWILRAGRLLSAARGIIGAKGFARYLDRELGMSFSTARRLMRAAEVFGESLNDEAMELVSSSVIYKLSEQSFPPRLREMILDNEGLVIDGTPRHLGQLRVKDVALAKTQFLEYERVIRHIQSEFDRTKVPALRSVLRRRLDSLRSRRVVEVVSPAAENRAVDKVQRAISELETFTKQRTGQKVPDNVRAKLKKILEEMEVT